MADRDWTTIARAFLEARDRHGKANADSSLVAIVADALASAHDAARPPADAGLREAAVAFGDARVAVTNYMAAIPDGCIPDRDYLGRLLKREEEAFATLRAALTMAPSVTAILAGLREAAEEVIAGADLRNAHISDDQPQQWSDGVKRMERGVIALRVALAQAKEALG